MFQTESKELEEKEFYVKYLCIYATQLRKEYLQKNPLITSIIYFNFHYFTISHGFIIFLLISYWSSFSLRRTE